MGGEHIGARKHLYLCLAGLIFFSLFGCATFDGMKKRIGARQGLLRGQEHLVRGEYDEALRENQEVYSMVGKDVPGDRALFNMGLIYADCNNPGKDYRKAVGFFKKLIEDHPQSAQAEEARIWVGTLEIIEQEKQVDIEIEKKKKELKKQSVGREEISPSAEAVRTVSQQLDTPVVIDMLSPKNQVLSRKKNGHVTVLENEGGSLYFLALNHYKKANKTIFDLILQANPSITDVRQIDDHQEIIVPVITADSYIIALPSGSYRVYIGTFSTKALATSCAEKVGSTEKILFIDPYKFSSQDTWYRLTMGDFNSKEEASATVSLLIEKGLIGILPELAATRKEKLVENERLDRKSE